MFRKITLERMSTKKKKMLSAIKIYLLQNIWICLLIYSLITGSSKKRKRFERGTRYKEKMQQRNRNANETPESADKRKARQRRSMKKLRESCRLVRTHLQFGDKPIDCNATGMPILGLKSVVQGSFHQGDGSIFSEQSVGRQCTCNSLIAICCNDLDACSNWNSGTLDAILVEGDNLYNNILSSRACNSPYLLVSELPVEVTFNNHKFSIHVGEPIVGLVDSISQFATLRDALTVLNSCPSCILTLKQYSVAVFRHNELFSVFDSHSRGAAGLSFPNGSSVLVNVENLDNLCAYLRRLASSVEVNSTEQFEVTPVAPSRIHVGATISPVLPPSNFPVDQSNETTASCELATGLSVTDPEMEKSNETIIAASSESVTECQLIQNSADNFRRLIKRGPDYVCTCCHRRLYRHAVLSVTTRQKYNKASKLLDLCLTGFTSAEGKEWICTTCDRCLKTAKMPCQAAANALTVEDIPEELATLSTLEARVISQRIPFMRIHTLPRGGNFGIRGAVVNVPADLTQICTLLPRNAMQLGLVGLKLKRKLSYAGHVMHETIRPSAIEDGLRFLMRENKHYHEVNLNNDWTQQSAEYDAVLWENLTKPVNTEEEREENDDADQLRDVATASSTDHSNTEAHSCKPNAENPNTSGDSSTDSSDSEEESSRSPASALDTCLQPEEGVIASCTVSVAPGEGQRPLSFRTDSKVEVLSFPKFFPSGEFGYDASRQVKLTLRRYFNARLLNKDNRFSESTEYIFFAQYVTEANQIHQSIGTAMRKSKGSQHSGARLTAGSLRDPEAVRRLLNDDEAYKMFSSVRGSPSSRQKMQYDCLSKLRQLGPYTWFFTFSVADTVWPEIIQVIARQYGVNFTDQQVACMSWPTKCHWLRRNPVIAARHADYMFQQLLEKVILAPPHPIGQLLNYDIKKEAQHRGPMHFHGAAHVQGAPKMDTHSDEEIIKFINRHVKCTLPSEEENEELTTLVKSLQTHHHTGSCKKRGESCCYRFPKPACPQTVLARPPDGEDAAEKRKEAEKILKEVYRAMTDWNAAEPITLSGLLNEAGVSEQLYVASLKVSTSRCSVMLKRDVHETNINNYNPSLLKIWRANMDLQYVFDAYACIMYVTSYLCKAEKTMSQLLRAASREANDEDVRKRLNKLGNVFLTHRELTSHEAVCRILSIPLRQSNQTVIFIPCGFPHSRTRLLKPKDQLKKLEVSSTSVFMTNLIDRYAARPDDLQDMCYAEFAAHFTVKYDKPSNDHEEAGEADDGDTERSDRLFTLRNNLGIMRRRKKDAIIRYHMPIEDKNREEFYYSSLLLFYPWQKEEVDLTKKDDSYYYKYQEAQEIIQMNKAKFERNCEEVDAAFRDLEAGVDPQSGWDEMAAQVEQERRDDEENLCRNDAGADPEDETMQQVDIPVTASDRPATQACSVQFVTNVMATGDYYELARSLNHKQKMLHDFVRDWCWKRRCAQQHEELPKAFHIFLSGSGGVGKSHTVNAVYQAVMQTLKRPGDDPDKPLALLRASTGCAAFNIGGVTVHSALNLAIRERGRVDSNKLSNEKLHGLRSAFENLALIVIDEISMIGEATLLQIHKRLQEIMGIPDSDQQTVFGGISILAVGDLMQLPAVDESPLFQAKSKNRMARLYGNLFVRHFKVLELTEVHWQRNDPLFGDILNRIRLGEIRQEDMEVLESRVVAQDDSDFPTEALHVFATNKVVQAHNSKMLENLAGEVVTIKCKDTLSTKFGNTHPQLPEGIHATGGLHSILRIGTGAKISLT